MILHRAKATYIPQKPGMRGIYEKIEAGARTCYKSEGYTKYDEEGNSTTAEEFANKIINVFKHRSVAEHAAIYMIAPEHIQDKYKANPYSRVNGQYITTNYRVIIENGWQDDLKYMCEPTEHHEKRYTVRVFTDRGVSAELNRHRVNSPSERSTRYVKQADEITFMVPESITGREIGKCLMKWTHPYDSIHEQMVKHFDWFEAIDYWMYANLACEFSYINLLKLGWKPQEARRILPLDIETELVISAYESDWKYFMDLRLKGTTGTPHPDMQHLARLIAEELKDEMDWIDEYLN